MDLGTLTWTAGDNNTFRTANPSGAKVGGKCKCNGYVSVTPTDYTSFINNAPDLSVMMQLNNAYIAMKNTAYSDGAAFKTALQNANVKLVYELATSTTESADPFTTPFILEEGGTESWTDAGTRDFEMPVGNETTYYNEGGN